MRLVIAEKPSLAQALAKDPGANRRFEGHLRRDAFAGRITRAAKREEVQCESLALGGRAKSRLEFDATHDVR